MALPGMVARGGGSVTIVSSIGGLRGSTHLGIYAISKAADMQLVRNLAVEWGPRNIRANADRARAYSHRLCPRVVGKPEIAQTAGTRNAVAAHRRARR